MSTQKQWQSDLFNSLWDYVKNAIVQKGTHINRTNTFTFWRPLLDDGHIMETFKLLLLLGQTRETLDHQLQQIKIPTTTYHFSINYLQRKWNELEIQKNRGTLAPFVTKVLENHELANAIRSGMKSISTDTTDIKYLIGIFYQYIQINNKNNNITLPLNHQK